MRNPSTRLATALGACALVATLLYAGAGDPQQTPAPAPSMTRVAEEDRPNFTQAQVQHWVMVELEMPSYGWWDSSYDARVGRDPNDSPTDRYRSYFQFDISMLAGKLIKKALISFTERWRYACTPEPVYLWRTGPIGPTTTWSNAPALTGTALASATTPTTAADCNAFAPLRFDLQSVVGQLAAGGANNLTLALASNESPLSNGAKVFDRKPYIDIEYNSVPGAPVQTGTGNATTCSPTTDAYVNTRTPALKLRVVDADLGQKAKSTVEWRLAGASTSTTVTSDQEAVNGQELTVSVPQSAPLTPGTRYEWRARSFNEHPVGNDIGPWSAWCAFVVDTTPPAKAPVVTIDLGGGFLEDRPVTATISSGGDPDVVRMEYALDGESPHSLAVSATPQTVQIVPHKEQNTFTVRSFDRAGNLAETPVVFTAAERPDPFAMWSMTDWNGDNILYEDQTGAPAPLHGNASFGEGFDGTGLSFDGGEQTWVDTSAGTLDSTQSFTIAAWVRLTSTDEYDHTAISVLAPHYTTAALRYYGRRWEFVMRASDADGAQEAVAASIGEAQKGVWTYLVAVYDSNAGRIRLYVNGKPQGTAAFTAPWPGTGAIAFGRNNYYGFTPSRWIGDLDEVRLYDYALSDRKAVSLRADWNAHGHWQLDEGAGTSGVDSAGNNTVAIGAGATWTTGRQGPNALHLNGSSGCGTVAGRAFTGASVVPTDASFTVAAWVRLDRADNFYTALSQDGAYDSAFSLGYFYYPRGWAFTMPAVDGPGGESAVAAVSPNPVQAGIWTHLAGVFDQPAHQLRLFVNGRLVATQSYTAVVPSTGAFQIGRAKNNGWWCDFWPGDLDDVRAEVGTANADTIAGWMNSSEAHGPRATWPLDETSGLISYDAEPGNGNTLALLPAVTHVPGKLGQALHIAGDPDGPAGKLAPAYTAGPIVRTDANFSVAAWVRPSSLTGPATVISQGGQHDSGFELLYDGATGRWTFRMSKADTMGDDPVASVSSPIVPQVGQWVHLTGTYNATVGEMRLYVNGALAGVTAYKGNWNADRAMSLGQGKANDEPANFWFGDIDEVHVTNTPMSPEEIRVLQLQTPMGPGAWWRLDESTGQNLADASGNGHAISMTGTVAWSPVGKCGAALKLSNANGWAFSPQAVLNTGGSYSVAAWVRLEATGTSQTLVSQQGTQSSAFRLRYDGAANKWAFTVTAADAANPAAVTVSSAATAQAGVWTHVAGVRDTAANQLRLYVNGQLSATTAATTGWQANGALTLGFGRSAGTIEGLNGYIDEVRALGRAATATDVQGMFATCDDVGPPPLPEDATRVRLRSQNSNLCLSESNGFSAGTLAQIAGCAGAIPVMTLDRADTDRWQITGEHPMFGHRCLGIAFGSTSDGAPAIDSSTCDPADSRLFRIEPVSAPLRGYRLHPRHTDKCLGVEGNSTAEGAQLVQQTCSPTANGQVFAFDARMPLTVFRNDNTFPISDNATVESPLVSYNLYGKAPHTLRVSVNIRHSFSGDLIVSLVAPNGQVYLLYNRTGGSTDDLRAQYTVDGAGQDSAGQWKLRVQDASTGDVGTITGWGLHFDYGVPVPPEPGTPFVTSNSVKACVMPGIGGWWGIGATATLSSMFGVAEFNAYYTESGGISGFAPLLLGDSGMYEADLPGGFAWFTGDSVSWYAKVLMWNGQVITTSTRTHLNPC